MAKWLVSKRDWKGSYEDNTPIGWEMLCNEHEIVTGGDSLAQVFIQGKPKKTLSGQQVYDLRNKLEEEDVRGYDLDSKDYSIVIEK